MSIIWYNEKPKDGIATMYDGNITLNKIAIDNLTYAYSVMLGIDYQKKEIVIKPLTKELDLRGDIPEKQKYKITIRSSYGRISNKEFMKEVSILADKDFKLCPCKYPAVWDALNCALVIKLQEECV